MASKRNRISNERISGETSSGFREPEDDVVASDEQPIGNVTTVGRTPSDLIHESGGNKALSRLLHEIDPLEVLLITAYVILSGWGNSQHPIWPFSYFGLSILGYHLVGRPLARYFMRLAERSAPKPTT